MYHRGHEQEHDVVGIFHVPLFYIYANASFSFSPCAGKATSSLPNAAVSGVKVRSLFVVSSRFLILPCDNRPSVSPEIMFLIYENVARPRCSDGWLVEGREAVASRMTVRFSAVSSFLMWCRSDWSPFFFPSISSKKHHCIGFFFFMYDEYFLRYVSWRVLAFFFVLIFCDHRSL